MIRLLLILLAGVLGLAPGLARAQATYSRSVNTLAELQALRPSSVTRDGSAIVAVRGRTVAGDWGRDRHWEYTTNTSVSPNLGWCVAASGTGRWLALDRTNSVQDARDWGAVGDGVTDDYTAIQAALDSGADTVVLNVGTNSISQPLVLSRRGQKLRGTGAILEATILTNIVRIAANDCEIYDLRLIGRETISDFDPNVGFYRVGVWVEHATNAYLEGVKITGKSTGVFVENGEDWSVSWCRMLGIWDYTNGITGGHNGAGVAARDANGKVQFSQLTGFGQGLCVLNRTNAGPQVVASGNIIRRMVDNGIYLVAANNANVYGNHVYDVIGSGIKTHGSGHTVQINTITNAGLGIAVFGTHSAPLAGSLEFYHSTNRFGAIPTNWFTGLGSIISGNIIRHVDRHGIDAGYTTLYGDYFWNRGTTIAHNNITDFGTTSTDIGIRASGDAMYIVGNTISQTRGTNATYGILFGGQTADAMQWQGVRIQNNRIELPQTWATGMQISDAAGINISGNPIDTPNSVAGLVLSGLTDARLVRNELPASQIRFAINPSTNVNLLLNERASVQQIVAVENLSEILADTSQLTLESVRTPLASSSATYPWALTVNINAQRGFQLWNKSDETNSLAVIQVNAGTTNSASGQLAAYPGNSYLSFAGRLVLSDNSDTDGITIHTALAGSTVDIGVAGSTVARFTATGASLYQATSVVAPAATIPTHVLVTEADPTSTTPRAVRARTMADFATDLGVVVGGGGNTLARFLAQDGEPPASSYATFGTRNSAGVLLFDSSVQEASRFRWLYPDGYTATNITVRIKWTTSATSGDARWGARCMVLTGDIDSDSFDSAVEATTTTSATAGTVMTTTLSSVSLDGAVAGDQVWTEIYRDVGDAADTVNSNDLELLSVEILKP